MTNGGELTLLFRRRHLKMQLYQRFSIILALYRALLNCFMVHDMRRGRGHVMNKKLGLNILLEFFNKIISIATVGITKMGFLYFEGVPLLCCAYIVNCNVILKHGYSVF